jgi:hypothetical protein
MAGHKKRNGGCGCGGMCGNPHCGPKRRNPSINVRNPEGGYVATSYVDRKKVWVLADHKGRNFGTFATKPEANKALRKFEKSGPLYKISAEAQRESNTCYPTVIVKKDGKIVDVGGTFSYLHNAIEAADDAAYRRPDCEVEIVCEKYVYDREAEVRQAFQKRKNPSINVRNPSRKVNTGSEDYRLGLFQGAMEKGKLPPPHDTSADFKRGYADGAKVAAARPAASAESLGVYKATGSQPQAGAVLYDAVKGESVATLRNPSINVRNPMSAAARKHLAHEKGEEKAFASMMAALAEGVTVKVGAHRIRKLSKGYVVVDGERLTTTQAAAKLHRGK